MKIYENFNRLKPKLKVEESFDLRTLDTNIIVEYLEEQIKLRDEAIDKHIKKALRK